jgi:ABC-type uncharacterized transport system permease subunit
MKYVDLNSNPVMSRLLPLVMPPREKLVREGETDRHLLNPIDAIIQILQIIRDIPRRGDWSVKPKFPDLGL